MHLHANDTADVRAQDERSAHVSQGSNPDTHYASASLSMDHEGEIYSPPLDEHELEHYWAVGGSD
jgi:hypothetical protein